MRPRTRASGGAGNGGVTPPGSGDAGRRRWRGPSRCRLWRRAGLVGLRWRRLAVRPSVPVVERVVRSALPAAVRVTVRALGVVPAARAAAPVAASPSAAAAPEDGADQPEDEEQEEEEE